MEEYPRYGETDPDDKPEQGYAVDDGKSTHLFPELLEVRNNTDGKEGQQEEELTECIRLVVIRLESDITFLSFLILSPSAFTLSLFSFSFASSVAFVQDRHGRQLLFDARDLFLKRLGDLCRLGDPV